MDLELNTMTEALAEAAQQSEAFSAINLRRIRGEVKEALAHFGRLGLLEEYTKHDMSHIDAMLTMYDWMIPDATRKLMSPADWLLITLSTYLHDFGLLITRDEYVARDSCAGYIEHRRRVLENDDPAVSDYRSQLKQMEPESADAFLYQEFVRANHAQRIRSWLQEAPDPALGVDLKVAGRLRDLLGDIEETFREDVGIVCESHHLDDLNDRRRYPLSKPYGRTRAEEANVQYAAFLLRTSDLLHITKDRVPSMAALIINPRNPTSQVEWAKQSAVRSVRPLIPAQPADAGDRVADPDTIEVHATFKEAEGFFGLTAYLQYANRQIAQTFVWSRENKDSGQSQYVFPWRRIDTSHIEAKGFIAEPFEFTIDQGKILDLLTGHTLYNDTGVVVREIVQNSLDAVRLQMFSQPQGYEPRIEVKWDSAARILEVSDNGTGMTQNVIESNFLRVGSSRYQDAEFVKQFPDFSSISRFGIGVLSTFMVADDVSVFTNHPSEPQARQLSLRDVHGQYLVRLVDRVSSDVPELVRDHGTSVRIKFRPSAKISESIEQIMQYWIVFPACTVSLTIDENEPVSIGKTTVAEALAAQLVEANLAALTDEGTLRGTFDSPIEIRTVKDSGREIAFAVAWSKWIQEWTYVRLRDADDSEGEKPVFGTFVEGIRVTEASPGFRSGGIAAMANLSGKKSPRTNVARSSLERTEEYDAALRAIYAAYVGHVSDEMQNFEMSRASSLTRAAQEANYLVQDLVRADVESPDFLNDEIQALKAIVVEEGGSRQRQSLADLQGREELVSLESTTIESFERVLATVRGGGSSSLAKLLDALGASEVLPNSALICGLGRYSMFSRMFTSAWDVVALEADSEKRTLTTTWRPTDSAPRWLRVPKEDVLPPQVIARMHRELAFGRPQHELAGLLFSSVSSLPCGGFTELLVSCHGRLLVLAEHPFLSIEKASDSVPDAARLWAIGWLVASMVPDRARRRPGPIFFDPAEGLNPGARWISNVTEVLSRYGLLDVLSADSVRETLARPALEVLDVQRWDRRFEPTE